MKGVFFLFALLFLLPLTALAAPEVSAEVSDYDFGEVTQGDKVDYVFRFRNSGDALLEISSISSSCGCTAALLSSKRIAAGETGEIRATFDSSRFRGRITKTITLDTNAPAQSKVVFRLRGVVNELLSLSTRRINWNWSTTEQIGNTKVRVKNLSQQTVRLGHARTSSEQITLEVDRPELAPGEEAVLTVSGTLPQGAKRLNGYLLVDTDLKAMPQIRVAVSGRLTP